MDQSTATTIAGVHRADDPALTPRESAVVDARQDDLMASESADGRPPSHRQRMTGWRWVAIGLPVLVLAAAIGAWFQGVSVGLIVGLGIVFLLSLLVGGWPVAAAGLHREKEETTARKEAVSESVQTQGRR